MSEFYFTVYGNQEGPLKNPIPYKRTTQRAKHSAMYQRYMSWKQFVISIFIDRFGEHEWAGPKHPLTTVMGAKRYINCMIYYANYQHGDSSNVLKGVEDALFEDDKYLASCCDFDYDKERPRVEISISDIIYL